MQETLFDSVTPTAPRADLELVRFLHDLIAAYQRGELGGTSHEVHPNLLHGSRENYLFFTLAPSINFQRKSEALWRAADRTYRDRTTRFVFFPEEVRHGRPAYAEALAKYSLAALRDKHTDIWFTISQTLAHQYNADPRTLLSKAGYDVLCVKSLVLHDKKAFPYLSGPKLLNYWLYMLSCFTDAPLRHREAISIIPDTHVIQASVRLGVVSPSVSSRETVAGVWTRLLAGTGIVPIDLHAPLWRWSRMGFPEVRRSQR
jgi:hypothetical protein